jgi:small subunit ribosomal protein S16e
MSDEKKQVRTFGKKKNATAVALVQEGKGIIRVNGKPLHLIEPESMRTKVFEPIFIVGGNRFKDLSIRVRVQGGGSMVQVMAVRMAIAKGLLAYYQKYRDEATRRELKELFAQYDKNLLVSDDRRCEPKKFGGRGARARFQKSYR